MSELSKTTFIDKLLRDRNSYIASARQLPSPAKPVFQVCFRKCKISPLESTTEFRKTAKRRIYYLPNVKMVPLFPEKSIVPKPGVGVVVIVVVEFSSWNKLIVCKLLCKVFWKYRPMRRRAVTSITHASYWSIFIENSPKITKLSSLPLYLHLKSLTLCLIWNFTLDSDPGISPG